MHCLGRPVFCLHPHQTAYVVPSAAVVPVPADVPVRRAVLAGIVETAVNALWDAPPLRRGPGDRRGRRRARVQRGPAGVAGARRRGHPRRRRSSRAGVAAALGVGFSLPDDARRRPRPRRAHERHLRRAPALARPAGAGGDGARAELVRRRRDDPSSAGPSTRGGSTCAPARWAGSRPPAGRGVRRAAARRSRWTCSATRPSTPADGGVAVRVLPRGDAAAGRRRAAGAVPRGDVRRGGGMFSVTVRDHMMVAHSLPGRRVRPGAAAARRDVRGRRDVPGRGAGRGRDPGRHRPGDRGAEGGRRRADLPQPRRRAGVRRDNTTTEVLARQVADRLAERLQAGDLGPRRT